MAKTPIGTKKPARDPRHRYLVQIGSRWYVRITVPPRLAKTLGTHLRKALHTSDLEKANALKWKVVEVLKRQIANASALDPITGRALALRADFVRQEPGSESEEVLEHVISDQADIIKDARGSSAAQRFYKLATTRGATVRESFNALLGESVGVREQTRKARASVYEEFLTFIGTQDLPPALVTDEQIVSYVTKLRTTQGHLTARRKIGHLAALWDFMGERLTVPRGNNPWRGFKLSSKSAPAGTQRQRRAFTEAEMVKFLTHPLMLQPHKAHGLAVYDLYRLGFLTGMRLDEICSLTVYDVADQGEYLLVSIRHAKTKAGVRDIPVCHPTALAILRTRIAKAVEYVRRRKASKAAAGAEQEASLWPTFTPGGYDNRRSWHVQKLLGRMRKEMAETLGPWAKQSVDFHSTRRTFATLMESLGVNPIAAQRYIGHEVPTLMHTVYSSGSSLDNLLAVARAVRYPQAVEEALKEGK